MLTPDEWMAVRTSLLVAGQALSVALPLAVLVAWVLARKSFPGKTLLDALVHAPLVLPPVVVGYLLLLSLGVQGPVGAFLLKTFGLRFVFSMSGAALAAGIMAFPLMVRALRLSFEAVDPRLELAARSLGAGPVDRFVSITLPLAAPGLLAAAVIGFAACLGEFGAVITFAANVPGQTQTLPLAIYSALQSPGGDATALKLAGVSFLIAIAALLVSELLSRHTRRLAGR